MYVLKGVSADRTREHTYPPVRHITVTFIPSREAPEKIVIELADGPVLAIPDDWAAVYSMSPDGGANLDSWKLPNPPAELEGVAV